MKIELVQTILEGMADGTRLKILQALREKPECVETLASRLNLASSTISFHMKKLESANLLKKERQQYYSVFQLNHEVFKFSLMDFLGFDNDEKADQQKRARKEREKLIRTFMPKGKLIRFPAQQKKQIVILEEIVKSFKIGREYQEKEVNEILWKFFNDHCLLRRLLVDYGLMGRAQGLYWAIPGENSQNTESMNSGIPEKLIPGERKKNMSEEKSIVTAEKRKSLKRAYKENPVPAGILLVRNLENGKTFIAESMNLAGVANRHEFQLTMGVHPNKELQEDWKKSGPSGFAFEILESIKAHDDGTPISPDEVKERERHWLEKLQPFGKKGYHTKPI